MNRRRFLQHAGVLALGSSLVAAADRPAAGAERKRRRVLRAAHLTDLHVMPPREGCQDAAAGMAAALRHAQGQAERPDLLLFGGDLVMDSLGHSKADTQAQWEVWARVYAAEVKTPARLCLGNHDVWGWGFTDQREVAHDPLFGKGLAMERLGLRERYYSFDQAGWHFVVLDSTQPDTKRGHGYIARLDDAQFAWLQADLAATAPTTPVCVLSHIPLLSVCVFFDGELEATGDWVVPGSWAHIDARRIKDLFRRHKNVKVCLSGHVHLADDVTYLGVRYLCNGAVCGGWWKGDYQEFPPAYALVDFYDDGTVENQLVPYQAGASG